MSKLGWFATYLIWTSLMGVAGWGLSALLALSPSTSVADTFAVGTWYGAAFATINILVYPLQLLFGLALVLLLNPPTLALSYFTVTAACLMLSGVGYWLRALNKTRQRALLPPNW
jgi:hypothetical protein